MLDSYGGNGNKRSVPEQGLPLDESSIVSFFPDWETRTRRPPGIEHLGVRSRGRSEPLKKIKDQVINAITHVASATHYISQPVSRHGSRGEMDAQRAASLCRMETLSRVGDLRRQIRHQALATRLDLVPIDVG